MCLSNEHEPTAAQRAWKAKQVWKTLKVAKRDGMSRLVNTYHGYGMLEYAPGIVQAKGGDDAGLHCFLSRADAVAEAEFWSVEGYGDRDIAPIHETPVCVTISGEDILAVGEFDIRDGSQCVRCVRVSQAKLSKTEHTRALCALRCSVRTGRGRRRLQECMC